MSVPEFFVSSVHFRNEMNDSTTNRLAVVPALISEAERESRWDND